MRTIYLDFSATTPVAPSVQEAMLPYLAEMYGDPSADYPLGRTAWEAIEDARGKVAALLGCDREEIVFTSSGSESVNLAIQGTLYAAGGAATGHVVISAIEHAAVSETARAMRRRGFEVSVVGCNEQGLVEPEAVDAALRPNTRLVSVVHANHELGVIQPIGAISEVCRAAGVPLHTDACQSVGKISTSVEALGVDLLSLTGHKIYAPKGIGALYVRRGTRLEPILYGDGNEAGLRAGTENTAFIVGLGMAARLAARSPVDAADRLAQLRDRLQEKLAAGIGPRFAVLGEKSPRLPHVLAAAFPGVAATDVLARAAEVCAMPLSAARQGSDKTGSCTLAAMGVAPEVAHGAVRFSVGWYTAEEEIDAAASRLIAAWDSLR